MTLKEYQTKCLETAIYPNQGSNYIYPFLGLIGEFTEFYEKAELCNSYTIIEIKKELGDVYWYLVMCCYEFKIDLEEDIFSCDDYYPENNLKKVYTNIGKLSELFKKKIRDDSILSKDVIQSYLASIDINLFNYMLYRGWYQEEILQMNIDKLQDRKNRNVLKGSGDER